MPVSRFAPLAGIPERTYRQRLARLRGGEPQRALRPSPRRDRIEPIAAEYGEAWPAWGHRKIAASMRADGYEVSTSTVERALRHRGLLLPPGFRADRKSWAALRRKVFRTPPTRRNVVWQGPHALKCLQLAVAEAEHVLGLNDLRTDRRLAEVFGPHGESAGMAPAPIAASSPTVTPWTWKYTASASSTTPSVHTKHSETEHPRAPYSHDQSG
nr:hypothetical protein [Nocardia brasiliensis]